MRRMTPFAEASSQALFSLRWLVRGLYLLPILAFAGLIYFRIPDVPTHWGPFQQRFMGSLLLMAASTFPLSGWLSRRFLRLDAEVWSDPEAVRIRLRNGVLILASLGEACAVYGWALYCVSGDTGRPLIFLFLSAGHYVFTMSRIDQAESARGPQSF